MKLLSWSLVLYLIAVIFVAIGAHIIREELAPSVPNLGQHIAIAGLIIFLGGAVAAHLEQRAKRM
jgi:hypothetical protein